MNKNITFNELTVEFKAIERVSCLVAMCYYSFQPKCQIKLYSEA